MAVVAIGDVHGQMAPLRDLTDQLVPTLSRQDVLVFLGDYIDKGPDVRGCVDHIIRLKNEVPFPVVALAGNHEHYMLRTLKDDSDHSWIWFGGLETVESYSAEAAAIIRADLEAAGQRIITEKIRVNYGAFESVPRSHLEFFAGLTAYHETADLVCVHAGVDPRGGPMEMQQSEVLVWGVEGFPTEYRGARPVVYGHWDEAIIDETGWPWPRILNNHTFGIDTISTGVLSAMSFPDRRLFQSHRHNVVPV